MDDCKLQVKLFVEANTKEQALWLNKGLKIWKNMDDRDLAYKLVDIRYNNLIQVQKVEFLERCLCRC